MCALTALGIIYGDIGTSPLYAFKQAAQAGGTLSPDTILGVVSLILWTDREMRISLIRLSDKTSAPSPTAHRAQTGQTHEREGLVGCGSG